MTIGPAARGELAEAITMIEAERYREDVRTRLERPFPDVPSESPATTAAEAFAFFADTRVPGTGEDSTHTQR